MIIDKNQLKLDDNIKEKIKKEEKKEEKEDLLEGGDIIKLKEYSVVDIKFSMKGIDIYIPIDPISHNTSIIFMTLEIPIEFIMETDVEIESNAIKILKINYNIKNTQLFCELKKGNLSIYDYKEDVILLNSIIKFMINLILDFQ